MENNITLTTQLTLDDQIRIDKLTTALNRLSQCIEAAGNLQTVFHDEVRIPQPETVAETPQEDAEPVEQEQTPPEVETAENEPAAAETAAPAPTYTAEDVRAKATALMRAGKRAEAKAIVNEYAANITDLPADKCDEVMARLTALEG